VSCRQRDLANAPQTSIDIGATICEGLYTAANDDGMLRLQREQGWFMLIHSCGLWTSNFIKSTMDRLAIPTAELSLLISIWSRLEWQKEEDGAWK